MREIEFKNIPKVFNSPLCDLVLTTKDIEKAINITFWKDSDDLDDYLGAVIEFDGVYFFFQQYLGMQSIMVKSSETSQNSVLKIKKLLNLTETGIVWISPLI